MSGKETGQGNECGISRDLDGNLAWALQRFDRCQDIVIDRLGLGESLDTAAFVLYCETLIEESKNDIIRSTIRDMIDIEGTVLDSLAADRVIRHFERQGPAVHPSTIVRRLDEAELQVWQGCIVLFVAGWDCAVGFKAASFNKRQVTEPVNEPAVQGPREGTVELLGTNLGMLRQRVRTSRLKIEYVTAGEALKSKIAYVYLEEVVNPELLAEFRRRIADIPPQEIMETSFVDDWIEDQVWSPFPQFRYTERPDSATAALMDGKILVLVDNSPMILICPAFLVDFFSTSEDYYVRTWYSIMIRQVRVLAFVIALTLPSIYIALSTFHPELIPSVLLIAILNSREGIPFPAFLEALMMEISFELLREAGIRLPRPVGPAVSIVGALVIGQAAISAKIASPIMVIVVALTGIASFAIPHYDMAMALRVLRFPLMVAAGTLGGYGLMLSFILILLHLTSLRSLGEPYLSSLAPFQWRDMRDIFVRLPMRTLLQSPRNRRLQRIGPSRSGGRDKGTP